MRIKPTLDVRRAGLSLMEMMVATSIMATLMTSVVVVVRSGFAVWNAAEAEVDVLENAYGVLRHFVQQLRQAKSITAISNPTETSGYLSFATADGSLRSWTHNSTLKEVSFDNGVSSGLLAQKIDTISFVGYEADGSTQTINVDDIQVVKCSVQVTLPRGIGSTRTISCRAWIRSW